MIRIDRARVEVPEILGPKNVEPLMEKAAFYYQESLRTRLSRRYEFRPVWTHTTVRDALNQVFSGKCGYCELKPEKRVVDHFRPRNGVQDPDGTFHPDHYWWLAYDWNNLYQSCVVCNRSKGQRFPVKGKRVKAEPGAHLSEKPLLIDPCLEDPAEHLVFQEDGYVTWLTQRGEATIETFNLNRSDLVNSRAMTYKREIAALILSLETLNEKLAKRQERGDIDFYDRLKAIEELIGDQLAPQMEFSALRRQFIQRWMSEAGLDEEASAQTGAEPEMFQTFDFEQVSQSKMEESKVRFEKQKIERQDQNITTSEGRKQIFQSFKPIERIFIQNIKSIKELELNIAESSSSNAPWTMLLGENSTGKSTILTSIALTLAGRDNPALNNIDPEDIKRIGAKEGRVELTLAGSSAPIVMRVTSDGFDFGSHTGPQSLLLGYGTIRLLPRDPEAPVVTPGYVRIENLFNPFAPLIDADKWLYSVKGRRKLGFVKLALKRLLVLKDEDTIHKSKNHIWVRMDNTRLRLKQLSDGFQSVLALSTDIMSVVLQHWESPEIAEGVVLIDEIGAYLHPRWKMLIVSRLREVFPRVQFIATTHDPLCLKGMLENEVIVMKRKPGNQVYAIDDLPSVRGLRADQILTSPHFGLNSTLDPDIEEKFNRYYAYLANHERTEAEQKAMEQLERELNALEQMGTTRRERLMYRAIDQYLAEERAAGPEVVAEDDEVIRDILAQFKI